MMIDVLEQVRRRSAAERAGIKVGDLVLAINDVTTGNLTHQQVLDLVSQQQLTLQLTLYRYTVIQLTWARLTTGHCSSGTGK